MTLNEYEQICADNISEREAMFRLYDVQPMSEVNDDLGFVVQVKDVFEDKDNDIIFGYVSDGPTKVKYCVKNNQNCSFTDQVSPYTVIKILKYKIKEMYNESILQIRNFSVLKKPWKRARDSNRKSLHGKETYEEIKKE